MPPVARGSRNDPNRVTEKEYLGQVTDLLTVLGWRHQHLYPLQTAKQGWRTGCTSPGFPDLLCVRQTYLVAAELKGYSARGDAGRLDPAQARWLEAFAAIPTGRAWLLRPTDPPFATLVEWLRNPREAPKVYGWQGASDSLLR